MCRPSVKADSQCCPADRMRPQWTTEAYSPLTSLSYQTSPPTIHHQLCLRLLLIPSVQSQLSQCSGLFHYQLSLEKKRRIGNCFLPTIFDSDPDHTLKVRPFSLKLESRQDETSSSELFKKPAAKKRSMELVQTRKIRSRRRNGLVEQTKKFSIRIRMRLSTLRQHNKTDEMKRRRKHYFL